MAEIVLAIVIVTLAGVTCRRVRRALYWRQSELEWCADRLMLREKLQAIYERQQLARLESYWRAELGLRG